MKKQKLFDRTNETINATKTAIETMFDALNNGQQKKILKDEKVKKLFEKYNVERG